MTLQLPTLESVFLRLQEGAHEADLAAGNVANATAASAADVVEDPYEEDTMQSALDDGEVPNDALLSRRVPGAHVPPHAPSLARQLKGMLIARFQLKLKEPKYYIFGVAFPIMV